MALYRKYRPATFAEVVGQEHVTDPLSTALDAGRINHAYLFSGPRGCGKTSSARILARSLNCVEGPTSTPCGVCSSCVALAPGGPGNLDVIELDAASHGGVDDTRELRDRAFYAPAESRYRIFIVDEAHMVTTAGFNALLKIVEEPPEHLIFVFATTEPEKVLPTIRSRTHHYPFRLLAPSTMRGLLEKICAQENVAVEAPVYPLVIRAGGGSPRDSLSVLDQLLAGAGDEGVTYQRALSLLGVTDVALIDDAVDALAAGDGAALFGTVDKVMDAGHDPRRFAVDLLERIRDLILMRAVPDAGERGLVDAPGDVLERIREEAERIGPATLARYAEVLHAGLGEMRGATAPRLLLEVMCARMLLPSATDAESAVLQRLERLERRAEGGLPVAEPVAGTRSSAPAEPAARPSAPEPEPIYQRPSQRAAAQQRHPEPVQPASPEPAPPVRSEPVPPEVVAPAAAERGAPEPSAPQPADYAEAPVEAPAVASEPVPAPQSPEPALAAQEPLAPAPMVSEPVVAEPVVPEPVVQEAVTPEPVAPEPVAPPVETAPAREPEPAAVAEPEPVPSEPVAPPVSAPAAAGQPDATAVRAVWSEVRAKVRDRSRTVEVMLSGATVRAVENGRLILIHASAPLAKRLVEPRNADVIRDALREVFGVDWAIDCEVGTAAPADAPPRAQPARQQQAKPAGAPRFSRPSQEQAASAPAPRTESPSGPGADDIPPPEEPDYPDDPGPPPATPESVTPEDEEEMMAQAAEPADPSVRRDPEEIALQLLETHLGAKRIDG
ncbi:MULTISPECIES: DNA polymerase III subunits gamma/tau [unclassified Rhodococcus (in: high G+C Gram-positive bacteria)]|uniref:DNA polymerase III subunits gamma/tau n=1 Tax=unclassified Rhodococcus (in: high G+C Gram-positive bacteria) TaxID=192944 RepID=UPI000BC9241E|nr:MULTISPECIES: DNA polymerase III subunits gamma/tau [unclassified Rhodococcus (in: high G+C Gram-positive bacteria)]MBP1161124.1 DNA polymerase-3 subunit gamma/tau [Rhodococcus sp. PvR099]PTR39518.1 DNA polymerase-3 subunit gamma/tau [Rhodococcus sp. OK611]SNX92669.1 DNA polymerase-3 subunit gamma/tau [Rhodococcus sp. OK270]